MRFLAKIRSAFRVEAAIDLGTAHTLIYIKGQGLVLNEPSVVAVDAVTKEPKAVGEEARLMLGKTHSGIVAVRPVRDGVIENLQFVETMLRWMLKKALRGTFTKPILYIAVPSGANTVELKAVKDAGEAVGAKEVHLIPEPIAAAVGIGLPIHEPSGHMIVDIGGGTTEIAIISLGGIVAQSSIRVAGDEMNQAIIDYVRRQYNVAIGEQTAEKIKRRLGSAAPVEELEPTDFIEVRGRQVSTNMPTTISLTPDEVRAALKEPVDEITRAVRRVFENTHPDLVADIIEHGINLTGGGALLKGMDKKLSEATGLKVRVAERPLECVALGLGKIVENIKKYRGVILTDV